LATTTLAQLLIMHFLNLEYFWLSEHS